ncbi:MAG: hypothetical protein GY754_31240 [bacterium]|nr:hypothetical protein [bacterium]
MTSSGMHYVNDLFKQNGFDTVLINQANENLSIDEIPTKIIKEKPDLVLFNQFCNTREQVKKTISNLPDGYIYGIGGHDATFHSLSLANDDFIKQYKHVDFVWQGEVENGLIEFIKNFEQKDVPITNNNLNNRVRNLNTLPVLKHDDYSGEMGFLYTSRGCLENGCDFCTTPQFYKDGIKTRGIDHVKAEMENLKKNGKQFICVFDDNFLGFSESDIENAARIIEFGKDLNLKLFIMTRVDQIIKAHKMGYLAVFSGTVNQVFLGVENGSTKALKKLGKKCAIPKYRENSEKAIDLLYNNGISVYLGYINFYPDSTFDELESSANFLYKSNYNASQFHFLRNKLELFDGTKLLKSCQEKNSFNVRRSGTGYNYDFSDKGVEFLSNFFAMHVNEEINKLDYLVYESIFLIYLNQLQNTPLGKKFEKLIIEVNENNYQFFINALNICREKPELTPMMANLGDFKLKTKNSINEYLLLFPELIEKSKYVYHEPFKYIHNIS